MNDAIVNAKNILESKLPKEKKNFFVISTYYFYEQQPISIAIINFNDKTFSFLNYLDVNYVSKSLVYVEEFKNILNKFIEDQIEHASWCKFDTDCFLKEISENWELFESQIQSVEHLQIIFNSIENFNAQNKILNLLFE